MSEDVEVDPFQACLANFSLDSTTMMHCVYNATQAEIDGQISDVSKGLNTFFLIFGGAMVFFMQTGFAMLCAGCIRAKNVRNIILWNLLDSCGGGIAYWAFGYALSYGNNIAGEPKTFAGNKSFFLVSGDEHIDYEFWFFQWAFSAAVSSIPAGTIAERTQMKAYFLYSFFVCGFVYPIVAHAVWSYNGFLSPFAVDPLFGTGFVDLAGSGCVHMVGGVVALACVLQLGGRIGRFHDRDGNVLDEPGEIAPHSVTIAMLGTFCLWFGWYGFNPASVLFINTEAFGDIAALVTINTTLSACAGAVSALFTSTILDYYYLGYHTYDVMYTMNGCLTGLVAITSPCASVEPWAAVLIGVVAGWVYLAWSKLLVRLKIDDAVDAIPVHLGGGSWGVIAAGLLSAPELLEAQYAIKGHAGWFYEWGQGSGDFSLLGAQICGAMFIFGWTFSITSVFFYSLNSLGWLRVDQLEEEVGLDISRHKGSAYDSEGVANEQAVFELQNSRHKLHEDRSNKKTDKDNSSDEQGVGPEVDA